MTDILVKNVDVELLKKQRDWVNKVRPLGFDELPKIAYGVLELLDTLILNAKPKKKEYLVTRTSSQIVEAFSDDDARDKFEPLFLQGVVNTDTTVEEN